MNRYDNTTNIKLITFWSLVGIASIAFFIILIIMFFEYRPIETYDDISNEKLALIGNDMFTMNEDEYYVYIYSSKDENNLVNSKADELRPIIFNYFNFVKQNSRMNNVISIYGLDVEFPINSSAKSNSHAPLHVNNFSNFTVREADLPVLVRVFHGGIDVRRISVNDIQNELQGAMNKAT